MRYQRTNLVTLPRREYGIDFITERKMLAKRGTRMVIWHPGRRERDRIAGKTYFPSALKLQDETNPGEMKLLFEGRFTVPLLKEQAGEIAAFLDIPKKTVLNIDTEHTLIFDGEDPILAHWKTRSLDVPAALEWHVPAFRAQLDEGRIAGYAVAAGGLLRRLLLDASDKQPPLGILRDAVINPRVEMTPEPTSVLARTDQAARVLVGVGVFADHLARRFGEPLEWGELAWRFLASTVAELDNSLLPYLEIAPGPDQTYTVRIQYQLSAAA